MTDVDVSQGFTLLAVEGASIDVAQSFALVVFNYPALTLDVAQTFVSIPYGRSGVDDVITVSQSFTLVVVRGLPEYPISRAWTYTLDSHDMYLLNNLDDTLVCDLSQDPPAWFIWGTGDDTKWRGWIGRQWGAVLPYEEAFGSNVLVGDKATGTLYFLNPEQATDDDGSFEREAPVPFRRVVTGQLTARGRDYVSCPAVEVMGSVGDVSNTEYVSVELFTSDDMGHSYDSHGSLTVTPDDYTVRLDWQSLGSFTAPGRLFQLVDYGALTRIDDWEMPDAPSPES
jgi:hypothetical protein